MAMLLQLVPLKRWSYAFVALMYPFYMKSEVHLIYRYDHLNVNDRRSQVAMLQLATMNHRLIMMDDEVQVR